jgi:hypothetical protein
MAAYFGAALESFIPAGAEGADRGAQRAQRVDHSCDRSPSSFPCPMACLPPHLLQHNG